MTEQSLKNKSDRKKGKWRGRERLDFLTIIHDDVDLMMAIVGNKRPKVSFKVHFSLQQPLTSFQINSLMYLFCWQALHHHLHVLGLFAYLDFAIYTLAI